MTSFTSDEVLPTVTRLYHQWRGFTNSDEALPTVTRLYQQWRGFTKGDETLPVTRLYQWRDFTSDEALPMAMLYQLLKLITYAWIHTVVVIIDTQAYSQGKNLNF